jgi:UDP-N-acetylmuramoyl-tripeptide--D-alanyl-D-alanine ligase
MDSRSARPGSLFVAIRGGHAHVAAAVAAGASAVLVSEGSHAGPVVLEAPDTIAALQAIGRANRAAADRCTVVAVTGSSGKTSTKDVLAAICAPQRATVAALEGHNNEIGLPFTLTRIERVTELAICELSMRGAGQIAELAALACPQVAVITNVGEAHLELLGSREAIAAAKAEVLDGVELAVLPADEPLLAAHVPGGLAVVTFGEERSADVRIVERAVRADGMSVVLDVQGTRVAIDSALVGAHHARNLAAAFAVASHLGLDLARCADAAPSISLQRWRSEPHPLPGGGVVVNDAYNANPSATVAALAALAERGSGRLVAVLGPMAELGPSAPAYHRRVGEAARALGFAVIVAVGDGAREYLEGAGDGVAGIVVGDGEALVERLAALVQPGDRVLVKASRSIGLERVAKDLSAALAKVSAT